MNLLYGDSFLDYSRQRKAKMENEIATLSEDQLINSTDSLALIFAEKYGHSPVELYDTIKEDGGEVERKITNSPQRGVFPGDEPVYIKENQIRVRVPYDGEQKLLKYQPKTHHFNPIQIDELRHEEIVFNVNYPKNPRDQEETKNEITSEIENKVEYIESMVSNLNSDIENLNESLEGRAETAIDKRRDELETKNAILDGIGAKQDKADKRGFVRPDKKREIEIESHNTNGESLSDTLEKKTFIDVLSIIDDIGINIEQSGEPVRTLDEESLRDIFLTAINSHYEGLATGETFNRGGKTDIHLRHNNSNLFVAECKFWRGKSVYFDMIDQLLGNLTVRDTYASVVLFSRNKNYSEVEQKKDGLIPEHEKYEKSLAGYSNHDVYRFQRSSGVPVNLSVKLFDMSIL